MPATATSAYPMRTAFDQRKAYVDRLGRLKSERSSWDSHWSDLGRHILPRSPRFFATDRNRGGRERYASILDNTATRSLRVLVAGLMSYMTSPSRPWFRLTARDPELRRSHAVNLWLDTAVERMQMVFARSNVYRALPLAYEDMGCFGTGAMLVLSDFESVIRCYPFTIGEYCLEQDYQGRIVTVYREFERTVGEIVKEFGIEACSTQVKNSYRNRELETSIPLLHVIEPRADEARNPRSQAAVDMPWRSVYLELSGDANKLLRESGFRLMRLLAPRWSVYGSDVYGVSPAMEALGDIRQLQHQQLRKGQAIDYKTKPPLQVPAQMKDRDTEFLPGGTTYIEPASTFPFDQATSHGGIRTAFEVNLELDHLLVDIQDVRQRIRQSFYEDLFLMFAGIESSSRMTVPEVVTRQEEKLLVIGPVVERITNELLEPLIDITFQEMLEVGALPPPPPELGGRELAVEFVSVLAQAQRSVGITGVQQFVSDALIIGQTRPDVLDNINFDAWARNTARMRGVDNELLVDEASVQRLREARAEAEAAQEQVAMAQGQAKAIKDLSQAPVDQNSALDEFRRDGAVAG